MAESVPASAADPLRGALVRDLLAFVAAPQPSAFEALADRVVRFQADRVTAYGHLVRARGLDPETLTWRDAPHVPTELFREVPLVATRPDGSTPAAVRTFRTSGTTGSGQRGERPCPDLTLYHAGMTAPFVAHALAGDTAPRPWLSLIPPGDALPDSSLSHMITELAPTLADPASTTWAMAPDGLSLDACRAFLDARAADGRPALVLATGFALVTLLDALDAAGAPTPALPTGSRMMLTGGFKGRTRELSEPELLTTVASRLGLPAEAVVPEYGMTELTSQAYGRPLVGPAWLVLRVLDPATMAPAVHGGEGLVALFDLLALDNVSAILTSDLGRLDAGGGLTLLGRAPGAVLRGCSLTAEELGLREPNG